MRRLYLLLFGCTTVCLSLFIAAGSLFPDAVSTEANILALANSNLHLTPANPDISVELWAKEPMLKNTVAISHDNKGNIYATEANRRKSTDLDTRNMRGLEPLTWPVIDYSIQSVSQRREVLREYLSPTTSLSHPWLKDFNKDGASNWHDLKEKSERVHFLEDTDGNGVADKASVFAEGFNTEVTGTGAGVLWHNNKVYFTVIPDLWQLEDHDNDGTADERKSLITGHGVHIGIGGHDLHGLTVGPDGRIYWSVGDKGANITSQEGRQFSYPNQGLVMRSEPDGSNFEVFAHGLRNCMELAFDDYGNLFCVDNDGDFKGERERMVYVTRYSDTGWRINWQYNMTNEWAEDNGLPAYNPWLAERLHVPYFEGQAAYITPALENYSDGPAGFARNPGTALSPEYKDFFFVTQFPGQKITAFQMQPKGAAFEMANEHNFQNGFMATGLSFGPDGALYVADWGGNWEPTEKGGIFKLDVKSDPHPLRAQTAELLAAGFAQLPTDSLTALLNHPDQRVRLGAQFALVDQNQEDALTRTVFDTLSPQLARIHGIWGLGQLARTNNLSQRIPVDSLLADSSPQIRIQAARLVGEAPALFAEFESSLVEQLQHENLQVRFQAAQALGSVGTAASLPALFDVLRSEAGKDPFIRHSVATALAGVNDVQGLVAAKNDPSNSVRITTVVALRRLKSSHITNFLTDSNPLVVLEAARAIHDDFGIPEAMPALAALLNNTPHTDNEPLMRRVLNANYRLGDKTHAAEVLTFFTSDVANADLQKEALQMLQGWANPPVLDRVERRYRALDKRDPGEISVLLNDKLAVLLQSKSDNAVIRLLKQYDVDLDPELLQSRLADETRSTTERKEVLALLVGQSRQAKKAFNTAFSSASPPVRQEALSLMAESNKTQAVKRIDKILRSDTTVDERQHALTTLAGIQTRRASKLARRLIKNLKAGKTDPQEQLEVFFLAKAHNIDLEELISSAGEGAEAPYQYSMAGGDVLAGQRIFTEHPVAQCIRCHAVAEEGGSEVGPNLSGAGSMHNNAYLMESMVAPSASLATGFDNAAGISAMPPMGQILSAKELRDVMAYLGSL